MFVTLLYSKNKYFVFYTFQVFHYLYVRILYPMSPANYYNMLLNTNTYLSNTNRRIQVLVRVLIFSPSLPLFVIHSLLYCRNNQIYFIEVWLLIESGILFKSGSIKKRGLIKDKACKLLLKCIYFLYFSGLPLLVCPHSLPNVPSEFVCVSLYDSGTDH